MGRIILHVGMHKTGTTTIQDYLHGNRAALLDDGICYPDSATDFGDDPRRRSSTAHFSFARAINDAPVDARARSGITRFHDRIGVAMRSGQDVVISAESIYRHIALVEDGVPPREEDKYRLRGAYVAKLGQFFDGYDTAVLCYFRRPDSFAESAYAEAALNSALCATFDEFIRMDRFRFDYRFQAACFESFLPSRFGCFEDAAREGVLQHFFDLAELPHKPQPSTKTMRASPPKRAIQWIMRCKSEGELTSKGRRHRWLFSLQADAAPLFAGSANGSFWASTEQRDAFVARALDGFDRLAFPEIPAQLQPLAEWADDDHHGAEAAFADWHDRNHAAIADRDRRCMAPFDDPGAL